MADIDLLFVIHEGVFHYQCICNTVLELRPFTPRLKEETEAYKRIIGVTRTADDYVEVDTWMDCPLCRTRYQIVSIDYDREDKQSGCMKADLSPASGATTSTGARLRMMMDDPETL